MTTYVFTSISRNYIPKARVLAESVKQRSDDVRFCVLLAEPGTRVRSPWAEVDEVLRLGDLRIPSLMSWVFRHELVELCTAVKGACLQHLLERSDCKQVFYFDPDILVLSDVSVLAQRFSDGSVLLTPHLTEPESSLESIRDNEISALRHGTYNLGFLAVRNDQVGTRFASWWWDRLRDFCFDDIPGGLFTDQKWVDLAPAFFEEVAIIRHPGWNVATWNLAHRRIAGNRQEGMTSNGEPVHFYHFSGLDSGAQLAMLDKYGHDMPALYELRAWYLDRCAALDNGDPIDAPAWNFDRFDNDEPITRPHRVLYRQRVDLQSAFPNPYHTAEVNASYYHWFAANHAGYLNADSDPVLRCELDLYKREIEAIHSSRSWRLACTLRKWLGPLYRFFGTRSLL